MKRCSRLACAVSLATTLVVTTACADDRAATAFEEGRRAFARRAYVEAAVAFEESAHLVPHPAPLQNAIEAWELAGNEVRAAAACDELLALTELPDATRRATERRLVMLTRNLGTLTLSAPDAATVRLDGGNPAILPKRLYVSPGRHSLVATFAKTALPEDPVDIEVAAGETKTLAFRALRKPDLAPVETPALPKAPVPEARTTSAPPLGTWISFGVAGVFAGATAVLGVRTLAAKDEFDAHPSDDTRDAFYRERAFTNGALALTVLAAGTGVVLWAVSPKREAASAAVSMRATSMTVTLRF